jgi:hypothetical protein
VGGDQGAQPRRGAGCGVRVLLQRRPVVAERRRVDQDRGAHADGVRDREQLQRADLALTGLDVRDRGPVGVHRPGEGVLGEPGGQPGLSNSCPEIHATA